MNGIETKIIGNFNPAEPTLVFLHEGLGSVSAWRNFPSKLCEQCGIAGFLYSRYGYGKSPVFDGPLATDFMHDAARQELTDLLNQFGIERPILIGHSDGASIALIYAAGNDAVNDRGLDNPPLGVVVMAPHIFVEPLSTESIAALKTQFNSNPRLQAAIGKHHTNGAHTFNTWTNAWLDPAFRQWDIQPLVSRINCPLLAIQGHDDEYGTMAQITRIANQHTQTELVQLDDCGHSPHVDQPQAVLDAISGFVAELTTP